MNAISIGVDRMQRNFEPMRRQIDLWRESQVTDATAKLVIYEAFIESELDVPKHLARVVAGSFSMGSFRGWKVTPRNGAGPLVSAFRYRSHGRSPKRALRHGIDRTMLRSTKRRITFRWGASQCQKVRGLRCDSGTCSTDITDYFGVGSWQNTQCQLLACVDLGGKCDARPPRIITDTEANSSDAEIRSTLLHEMAHAAAGYESLAHGYKFWAQVEWLLKKGAPIKMGYAETGRTHSFCAEGAVPARFPLARKALNNVARAELRRLKTEVGICVCD